MLSIGPDNINLLQPGPGVAWNLMTLNARESLKSSQQGPERKLIAQMNSTLSVWLRSGWILKLLSYYRKSVSRTHLLERNDTTLSCVSMYLCFFVCLEFHYVRKHFSQLFLGLNILRISCLLLHSPKSVQMSKGWSAQSFHSYLCMVHFPVWHLQGNPHQL